MRSQKNKQSNKNKEKITIDEDNSSVSEFIRRPLPSKEEVKKFEDSLFRRSRAEKEETVKNSLSEIYKDDQGNMVNVKKIDKKKKGGIIFWFFSILFLVLLIMAAGAGVFYFIQNPGGGASDVEITVEAKDKIAVNEEFFCRIKYKNPTNADLNNVGIRVKLPENFLFLDSDPARDRQEAQRDVWVIDKIPQGQNGEIKIKGKMIGTKKESGVFLAEMSYVPSNFSSEFKKESSLNVQIERLGLDFTFDTSSSVLVGEEEELKINITPQSENYLDSFIIKLAENKNMEVLDMGLESTSSDSALDLSQAEKNTWRLSGIGDKAIPLKMDYRFPKKEQEKEKINLIFQKQEGEKKLDFLEKEIELEVIKSDMDLNLIINGSQKDQPVNFGEKLNYSIDYTNKGEAAMENVMIMAVLNSSSLDWTSLQTDVSPSEQGNTLTWSGEEISQLKKLEVGEGGTIDFSINVSPFTGVDKDKDYEIVSYAQFVTGSSDSPVVATSASSTMDNRSNTITNPINSDLRISEEVRYFSENNIPVGTGPLPPQVGEETTFKVYWTIKNNLHELKDTRVSLKLPDYLEWDGKKRTSVGSINYQEGENRVVWDVGRLPLAVYRADAEFSISLTPEQQDENKILVLSPGATVEAFDTQTQATITRSSEPKTTKLEDDDIADRSSDGRIEE